MELFAALVAGLLLIACFPEAGHRHRAALYFMGILALHVVLPVCDATLWAVSGTPGSEAPVAALALHRARSCLTYQRSMAGARRLDASLGRHPHGAPANAARAAGAFPSRIPPMRLAPYSAKRWKCEDACIAVLL